MSDTTVQQQSGEQADPNAGDEVSKGGTEGGYTPPATQADLNRIIADRISREREKTAKQIEGYEDYKRAAEELAALKESQKSDEQKRSEAADAQAKELADVKAENVALKAEKQIAAWKAEVSASTGISATVLRGSTKEEIEAHASELKTLIPAEKAPVDPDASRIPNDNPPAPTTAFLRDLFGGGT